MGARRPVTEEDLHVTEALIGDSLARLRRSITAAPSEAARPATNVVRAHPLAMIAAALGAGMLASQVLRLVWRRPARRKAVGRGSLGSYIVGQLIGAAAPYVVMALRQQIGRAAPSAERRP